MIGIGRVQADGAFELNILAITGGTIDSKTLTGFGGSPALNEFQEVAFHAGFSGG